MEQVTQNGTPEYVVTTQTCQLILYKEISNSRVRVWDLIILIPNCLFMVFLLINLRAAISKLRASNSPIFTAFYSLVLSICAISVLRCVVAMTVNAAVPVGDYIDKALWLVLRFFLLATELSVVIFGVAFGHLDSRTSIQRILFLTFTAALAYAVAQGTLEFMCCHPNFSRKCSDAGNASYDLFAHGGMIFLFTTSVFFFLIYSVIVVLPFTKLKDHYLLPTKPLFYYYCSCLAGLNLCQAVGSMLLFKDILPSLCVVDATTYIYFTFYNPSVYAVFLWSFFKVTQGGIQFSYKHHEDVMDDEQLSLPYSNGVSKHDDRSPIFDSTHFDIRASRRSSSTSSSATNTATDSSTAHRSFSVNASKSDFYDSGTVEI